MAALHKIGGTEQFEKANELYKNNQKGRLAKIFALFCLKQNEVKMAMKIVNLDYCLKNNILPKEPIQYNLQLLCLLKFDQIEVAVNTIGKPTKSSDLLTPFCPIKNLLCFTLKVKIPKVSFTYHYCCVQ